MSATRVSQASPDSAAFTEQQTWLGETRRKAALAVGRYLEETVRLAKPVRELTLAELEAMADNAISVYLGEREARRLALGVRFSVGLEPDPLGAMDAG